MSRAHEIPKPFYRPDSGRIIATTVGELKEALAFLPDDIPIDEEHHQVVVANINTDPILIFEEIEADDEDDWDDD